MFRRVSICMLLSGLVASCLVLLGAGEAAAKSYQVFQSAVSTHTDVDVPSKNFPNSGDTPVGAWFDADGHHLSKSYFTVDLSALRGATILEAVVNTDETAVTDCGKPRSTELWRTEKITAPPTWARQPKEREKLTGPGASTNCATSFVAWDAGNVVREAIATGDGNLDLVLRMADPVQGDSAYGRWYADSLRISITYSFPPSQPTDLTVSELRKCADGPLYVHERQPYLSARVTDPDGDLVTGHFVLWDVAEPSNRYEYTTDSTSFGSFGTWPPAGFLAEDHTYRWTVQATDANGDVGPVSGECEFTTDFTPPAVGPVVSSTDYPSDEVPHGGVGVPGRFTIDANGVADVVGYYFNGKYVPAQTLGGSATVEYTPTSSGPLTVYADSVDRAGFHSPTVYYRFWVRETSPEVTWTPDRAAVGVARQFTFKPRIEGVVSYSYHLNNAPDTVIAAGPDGTATVTLTPDLPGRNSITVASRTSDGIVSSGTTTFQAEPVAPTVTSDVYPEWELGGGPGVPGTFTFASMLTGITEYVYAMDGLPWNTVPAGPDGTASIVFTPPIADYYELHVYARNAEGISSGTTDYLFFVNDGESG